MKNAANTKRRLATLVAAWLAWLAQAGEASIALALDSPTSHQVFQRDANDQANIAIRGTVDGRVDAVEARAELVQGATRGKGTDWVVIAEKERVAGGAFGGRVLLQAGGWYKISVRARVGTQVVAEASVDKTGVGDVFVTAGQSNAANHGQERQRPKTGLVVAFDGKRWHDANDPQPGASGEAGSFMPPLGDAMADAYKVPIGIVACGIGATSVREWLPKGTTFPNPPTLEGRVRRLPGGQWESKGEAFEMLTSRMKQLGPKGFRAVLWHQGESDAEQPDPTRTLPGALYRQYLEKVIRVSRREIGWDAPWFVALVSSHGAEGVPDIRAAQKSLWDDGIALEGPDSDALRGDLRDGVHFTGKGLRKHGQLWAEKVSGWMRKNGIQ